MTFIDTLKKKFEDKGINKRTIETYLNILERLQYLVRISRLKYPKVFYYNDTKKKDRDLFPIKRAMGGIDFLNSKDIITRGISKYSNSTKRMILSVILSTLSLFKKKKDLYKFYDKILRSQNIKEIKREQKDKQEDKMTSFEYLLDRLDKLKKIVIEFPEDETRLTPRQYDKLLQMITLALYTKQVPRRNRDYQFMYLTENSDGKKKDRNYMDIVNGIMKFNTYKTSKVYGEQEVKIEDKLKPYLELYFKYHPLLRTKKKVDVPLLVTQEGRGLNQKNSITKILNRALGKNIGSSTIRHIYATHHHGENIKNLKKMAGHMGNSIQEQILTYIS